MPFSVIIKQNPFPFSFWLYAISGDGLVTKLRPTLVTPGTIALQAPLFMGLSKQEYWSG